MKPVLIILIMSISFGTSFGQVGRPMDTTGQAEKIKNMPTDTISTEKKSMEGENSGKNIDYNKPKEKIKKPTGQPDNTGARMKQENQQKGGNNMDGAQQQAVPGTPLKGETTKEQVKTSPSNKGTNPQHADTSINKAPANKKMKSTQQGTQQKY